MNWLDSHCHINDIKFNEDLKDVLENMVNSDVTKAMIVSCNIADYKKALEIDNPNISFKRSLGIYPGDVDGIDDNVFNEFAKLFEDDKVDAIGEIGLDYHYGKENKDKQIDIFTKQVKLAQKLNKPIIVHSRDAIQDTYSVLRDNKTSGVIHCYSDSGQMAKNFVKLGYYISISGTVTWKNAREPLEVIKCVPLDRLLIETDCPYLTPEPNRGKRNEPANVVYTGRFIANQLGINEELFKMMINDNYNRLFDKV